MAEAEVVEELPQEEDEQVLPRDDTTPDVITQARAKGWNAGYYDFGKAEEEGIEYFNPALIERPDGIWMLVRRSEPHPQGFRFGQNDVWATLLDSTGKVPQKLLRLRWPGADVDQHFEDPRGFYHPGFAQVLVGACTFIWYGDGSWTGAHQCFGAFNSNWECQKMDYPQIGGNPGQMVLIDDPANFEKNWLWFLHSDRLHLLYKANPWLVTGFGESWSERKEYRLERGVTWPFGEIRGGTTPVRVGNHYFTFPHSSVPWKGRFRRYFAGCLAFESEPPFHPVMMTPEPILAGSQNDVWEQQKPLVVFPCGAIYRNGKWLVSCGINDLKAAWIEIDHESLLKLMQPVEGLPPIPLGSNQKVVADKLIPVDGQLEKRRKQAEKARAALAEKRRLGLIPERKGLSNRKKRSKAHAKYSPVDDAR